MSHKEKMNGKGTPTPGEQSYEVRLDKPMKEVCNSSTNLPVSVIFYDTLRAGEFSCDFIKVLLLTLDTLQKPNKLLIPAKNKHVNVQAYMYLWGVLYTTI